MNNSKRIMILGASVLQLPAILKAKEMGLQVIAVDMDKNAIGFKDADIGLVISTTDIPKVVEAAKKYNIDGVLTLASDMPMLAVAAVAKELNIVGISVESSQKATNKALMRECLEDHNVPSPKFYKVNSYEKFLSITKQFKRQFIVKPADNSGSRGVFLVKDINNDMIINYAFEYSMKNSRNSEIIIEEYLEGPEVSVETLSIDGNVHIIAITDKLTTGAPRFVEMGHSQPSRLDSNTISQIKTVATAAVKAIGIIDGPSHTELIITQDGPLIVEIGARLGGDNITTHLVPLSTGVDMVRCCIEIALGGKPDFEAKFSRGSAIRYFETPRGRIRRICGFEEASLIQGIEYIHFAKKTGDYVGEIKNSADRIGFVIAQSDKVEEAILECENAIKNIRIEVFDN